MSTPKFSKEYFLQKAREKAKNASTDSAQNSSADAAPVTASITTNYTTSTSNTTLDSNTKADGGLRTVIEDKTVLQTQTMPTQQPTPVKTQQSRPTITETMVTDMEQPHSLSMTNSTTGIATKTPTIIPQSIITHPTSQHVIVDTSHPHNIIDPAISNSWQHVPMTEHSSIASIHDSQSHHHNHTTTPTTTTNPQISPRHGTLSVGNIGNGKFEEQGQEQQQEESETIQHQFNSTTPPSQPPGSGIGITYAQTPHVTPSQPPPQNFRSSHTMTQTPILMPNHNPTYPPLPPHQPSQQPDPLPMLNDKDPQRWRDAVAGEGLETTSATTTTAIINAQTHSLNQPNNNNIPSPSLQPHPTPQLSSQHPPPSVAMSMYSSQSTKITQEGIGQDLIHDQNGPNIQNQPQNGQNQYQNYQNQQKKRRLRQQTKSIDSDDLDGALDAYFSATLPSYNIYTGRKPTDNHQIDKYEHDSTKASVGGDQSNLRGLDQHYDESLTLIETELLRTKIILNSIFNPINPQSQSNNINNPGSIYGEDGICRDGVDLLESSQLYGIYRNMINKTQGHYLAHINRQTNLNQRLLQLEARLIDGIVGGSEGKEDEGENNQNNDKNTQNVKMVNSTSNTKNKPFKSTPLFSHLQRLLESQQYDTNMIALQSYEQYVMELLALHVDNMGWKVSGHYGYDNRQNWAENGQNSLNNGYEDGQNDPNVQHSMQESESAQAQSQSQSAQLLLSSLQNSITTQLKNIHNEVMVTQLNKYQTLQQQNEQLAAQNRVLKQKIDRLASKLAQSGNYYHHQQQEEPQQPHNNNNNHHTYSSNNNNNHHTFSSHLNNKTTVAITSFNYNDNDQQQQQQEEQQRTRQLEDDLEYQHRRFLEMEKNHQQQQLSSQQQRNNPPSQQQSHPNHLNPSSSSSTQHYNHGGNGVGSGMAEKPPNADMEELEILAQSQKQIISLLTVEMDDLTRQLREAKEELRLVKGREGEGEKGNDLGDGDVGNDPLIHKRGPNHHYGRSIDDDPNNHMGGFGGGEHKQQEQSPQWPQPQGWMTSQHQYDNSTTNPYQIDNRIDYGNNGYHDDQHHYGNQHNNNNYHPNNNANTNHQDSMYRSHHHNDDNGGALSVNFPDDT
jgi:hypothetical protein